MRRPDCPERYSRLRRPRQRRPPAGCAANRSCAPGFSGPFSKGAFLGFEMTVGEGNGLAAIEAFQQLAGEQRLGFLAFLIALVFFADRLADKFAGRAVDAR